MADILEVLLCPITRLRAKTYKITTSTNTNTSTNNKVNTSNKLKITGCSCYLPQLKKGHVDDSVKVLQTILNYLGYNCGTVDGIFGSDTDTAIKKYQKAQGLSADGIVGKDTWKALIYGKK